MSEPDLMDGSPAAWKIVVGEQAAEITSLRAQLEEARAALKPFVEEFEARRDAYIRRYPRNQSVGASNFDSMPGEWPMEGSVFSMRVFRQARSVLDAHKEGGKS